MSQKFCADCWTSWLNSRQNIDGQNEYGVQAMTCPHCQKPLLDSDFSFVQDPVTLYEVTVNAVHAFIISVDTRTDNFKRTLLMTSTLDLPFSCPDDFDLAIDGVVIDGLYMRVPTGTNICIVEPKTTEVCMYVFPHTDSCIVTISESYSFGTLKDMIARSLGCDNETIVLFIGQGVEFNDTQKLRNCPDLDNIMVLPRTLYTRFYP